MKKLFIICILGAFFTGLENSANAEQVQLTLQPIDNGLSSVHLDKESTRPDNGTIVAGNVPSYSWYYGCSPTSGGMIIGYWDSKPGYQNLFYGDASVQNAATRAMIASPAHITAGAQNGYTYGDWHNSTSYPNHESNPDCIADFMHTVDGGSNSVNIASGLEAYVEWDNPATPINESYQATALNIADPWWEEDTSFTYSDLKAEIDADRPVLLDLLTYHTSQLYGHSIACYGYQDNMFTIYSPAISSNIIVPGIAVDDTWQNGTAMSEWIIDADNDGIEDSYFPSCIDSSGVEWWPYYTLSNSGGASYINYWDWMFSDAVTLNITVPEPATICLLGLGALSVIRRKK